MSLHIEDPATHRLTRSPAGRAGESMTAAVREAVRERLERLSREQGGRLSDRPLEIGRECAAQLRKPFRSTDHGELLCHERGLPG